VTWTQAPSAEWTARAIHTSVVFDGKIWVLGGVAVTVYKNDVWYSSGLTGIEEDRDMPAAGPSAALCVTPNPLAGGFATVSFSLAKPGPMTASVHDVSGLCVATVKSLLQTRVGSVHLDLRKLASGVYLVRLEANGCSIRQKLIVQR
jgi:hypothetical protein